MKKEIDDDIPGQINLLDYLETLEQKDAEVKVEGAVNLKSKPISHYEVTASYGDIVLIVSMLRDYVRGLDEIKGGDIQWQVYYREKFLQIANKFQAQIGYDYDKAVENCRKKARKQTKGDDIGEDALILALKKQQSKGAKEEEKEEQEKKEQEKEGENNGRPATNENTASGSGSGVRD